MGPNSNSEAVPENESERLRRLHAYDILDSVENSSFDSLTSLARKILDVPVSAINLIDENRQWFLSETGLSVRELDRDRGICHKVVQNDQLITVEDFRDSSLVEGQYLVGEGSDFRSYAGAPLRTEDGFILGTFCVYDTQPREFTTAELDILRSFARLAMDQIDLRYGNEECRRNNRELEAEVRDLRRQLNDEKIEREELLHRTKNSFLEVKSILKRRRETIGDPDVYRALEQAETKLHTFMALYDQLHQTRTSDTLAIKPYLKTLVDNVRQVAEDPDEEVDVRLDIDDLKVNSEVAVKFGIALNELMTNAYQHVFLPGEGNNLEISFRRDGDEFHLAVHDDGPGMPGAEAMKQDDRTGLALVRDLIEHGDGSVDYEENDGNTITVTLPNETRE